MSVVDGGYIVNRMIAFTDDSSENRSAVVSSREEVRRMLDSALDIHHAANAEWFKEDAPGTDTDGGEGRLVHK